MLLIDRKLQNSEDLRLYVSADEEIRFPIYTNALVTIIYMLNGARNAMFHGESVI